MLYRPPAVPPSYVVTGMLGISISYHRQLSHKSFRCVKPLEYFFAYCGALAFEGDPIEWVGAGRSGNQAVTRVHELRLGFFHPISSRVGVERNLGLTTLLPSPVLPLLALATNGAVARRSRPPQPQAASRPCLARMQHDTYSDTTLTGPTHRAGGCCHPGTLFRPPLRLGHCDRDCPVLRFPAACGPRTARMSSPEPGLVPTSKYMSLRTTSPSLLLP